MNMLPNLQNQRGAVAVIVAITIGMLILVIGLVVDLGFLYTRKTELQNAADAAALAGAKELNGASTGIDNAVTQAIDLADDNRVGFGGSPVDIGDSNIRFAETPDGPWQSVSDAKVTGTVEKMRFIEVNTETSTVATWFAHITQWGFGGNETTSTFGRAVAGPDIVDMAPIAACALDGSDGITPPNACKTNSKCGYELGKGYKLSEVNPLGPGTIFWINPVTTDVGSCSGTGSTDYTLPFICQGVVAANVAGAPQVLTNTGVSTPQLHALDSRFDDYDPQAKCDPATAPPDRNIKQFLYDDTNVAGWMSPTPKNYVSPSFYDPTGHPANDGKCKDSKRDCQASRVVSKVGSLITTDYGGVVWSYVRPQADIPADTAGIPDVGRSPMGTYPGSGTPYTQGAGSNFFAQPTHAGEANRRVLTLAIVACPTSGGNCKPATVVGRGKFLLQRKAIASGDNDIYLEYGGPVSLAGITATYKLYR